MGSSPPSSVVYEGEVIIADFDPEALADLEETLEPFVDVEPDEELVASLTDGDRLEVRKIREKTSR